MIFELSVTADAAEIRLKVKATALCALVRSDRSVLRVRVLTNTARTPRVDIEALPSRQVPKSELLRASRYELERSALTLATV